MSHRMDRINESVARELADILRTVKDPRVSGAFLSVTGVDVSADLSYAKVYYSVLGKDYPELAKGLASASGYIRGALAERLNMRLTPKLSFIRDDTTERAMKVSRILKDTTYTTSPDGGAVGGADSACSEGGGESGGESADSAGGVESGEKGVEDGEH